MSKKRSKIFVGMSGGVDSSVAAAVLKQEGHDVTGVFIKVWQADFLPCNWREERRDAMRAAAVLEIPFLTLDLEKEYKRDVVDYMVREYSAGRIPNPDVMCNKHVKFGAFLDFALAKGAEFIATGHYARTEKFNDAYQLLAGSDKEKDQSYFLWTLTQRELAHVLFPIGFLEKREVRALAEKWKLPNAQKKDSQGLCFLGKVDMQEFLKHFLKTTLGTVLNESGAVIGTHDGALLYTLGQRHGFKTQKTSRNEEPYIVIAKDLHRNTITVAHRDKKAQFQTQTEVLLESVNFVSGKVPASAVGITARTRYRGELLGVSSLLAERNGSVRVRFQSPAETTPAGQSLVLYKKEECLGGGVVR